MRKKKIVRCGSCRDKECREGKDCFEGTIEHLQMYKNRQISRMHKAAAAIEARHYGKEPRLKEIILFAQEMGFKKVGLAFCIGLAEEAKVIEKILVQHFNVVSICCKVGGVTKKTYGLEQIHPDNKNEVMCNPVGQAEELNKAQTDLNILCGLCVGHDIILTMKSKAPVTTFVTKDRVLAHNPIGAVYSQYIRRNLLQDVKEKS